MEDLVISGVRDWIAGVAAGAAEGASALRRTGLDVRLEAYSVEARIADGSSAEVRIDFVVESAPQSS